MTEPGRPRVVALGGGHGLSASLAAARRYAGEVTAIVSVADDGGSSGRLRKAFGIPAPGDLRKCLVALAADPPTLWAAAFEHRFAGDAGELAGHPLGNIVIAGLAASTGDFEVALAEAGRLVGVVGRVLPATREAVVLKAEIASHSGRITEVEGQVAVSKAGPIVAVAIVPGDAAPPPGVEEALDAADQVVIGPGSLFTSVLAVLVVPAIADALDRAMGRPATQTVYVANLREQPPETEGMDLAAHIVALHAHGCRPDVVLWDPAGGLHQGETGAVRIVEADLMRSDGLAHDPARLAAALKDLLT